MGKISDVNEINFNVCLWIHTYSNFISDNIIAIINKDYIQRQNKRKFKKTNRKVQTPNQKISLFGETKKNLSYVLPRPNVVTYEKKKKPSATYVYIFFFLY